MTHQDIWLRLTNKHGHTSVEHFTVWDRELFISRRREIAAAEGGTITEITEQQFNEERHA